MSAIVDGMEGASDRRDIETSADCERLVRRFYDRALQDPIIGFLFTDVARIDLDAHIPVVASFWETILLGARTYAGGAFVPHLALHRRVPLRAGHFARWLALWRASVDELFAGPRAEQAKAHATRVARAFHGRLEGYPERQARRPAGAAPSTAAGGLAVTRHGDPGATDPGPLAVTRHGPRARRVTS